jgi:hypothetical protein
MHRHEVGIFPIQWVIVSLPLFALGIVRDSDNNSNHPTVRVALISLPDLEINKYTKTQY